MNTREQLERWVAGESVHNDETDECCPDFSCCADIDLGTDTDVRQRFCRAYMDGDEETMNEMFMMFLGQMMGAKYGGDDCGPKVYLAGNDVESAKP